MRCSKCGSENPTGKGFCGDCGASLVNSCSKCGAENPPTQRFCGDCGNALVAVNPSSLSASSSDRPELTIALEPAASVLADGERKTVTALFADLKGSTQLIHELDPEAARRIIDPALKTMVDAVRQYDGYVVQSTGDGIFALFGAPLAHEDHPQRALYAALAMQQALRQLAERLAKPKNQGLQPLLEARVGVNSGEVVMRTIETGGRVEYTPVGYVTNLASRLQTAAPAGGIAISEETRRLVEGYFELRSLGPSPIKGVPAPVNVYEVIGPGLLRTHFQLSARRGLTKFVGRDEELAHLKRAFELARRGRGQIAAIVAEAGTGKSRLVYEFKATITGECKLLEAYSVSHGKASPWLPVLELLRGYFGLLDADDAAARREKIRAALAALDASLTDALPYLWNLLSVPEEPDALAQMNAQIKRQRTLESLKRIALRESLNQPLVIIFEDLHWIDSETQALLDLIAGSIGNARVLMLVNYRPEYRHEWGNKSYYSQLRLEPLDNAAATEMLEMLVGDNPELGPLKRLIIERTEGNPFFIEEMLQALFDEGVVTRDGAVTHTRPLAQLLLPPTVQAILAARIDRQPSEHKQLLQTLAVIGRESRLDLIRQIVPAPEPQLHRMLIELQASEFINEQPAFPQAEYVFKHALTQEVAYNSMLLEQRKLLHERAGRALESIFFDQLDDHVGELARHYSSSDNSGKAVEYLSRAGRQAVQRSANAEAITHLNAALTLLSNLPATIETTRQELDLQMMLGVASLIIRGWAAPEVETVYARARQICEQLGDDQQLTTIVYGLWQNATTVGDLPAAFELAEELMAIADRRKDSTFLLVANFAVGLTVYYQGHFEQARDHADRGLSFYNPAVHRPLAFVYGQDLAESCQVVAGWSLWSLGYPDQALKRCQKALEWAQEPFHAFSSAVAFVLAAIISQFCRHVAATEEYGRKLRLHCERHGISFFQAWGMMFEGWAAAEQGRVEDGLRLMRHGLVAARQTGAKIWESLWLALQVQAWSAIGDFDEAFSLLNEALTQVEQRGERFYEAELWRLKGELILKRTHTWGTTSAAKEAELQFRHAIAIARRQQGKSLELRATTSLARLLADAGRRDEARTILADIYNWFTEGFDTADLKDAKALLDDLSE